MSRRLSFGHEPAPSACRSASRCSTLTQRSVRGLRSLVASQPDLQLIRSGFAEGELWPRLRRTRPDVVVLDVGPRSGSTELLGDIRTAAASPRAVAPVSAQMRGEAAASLDPAEYPIFAMRLAGEPAAEIGRALGPSSLAVKKRIAKILARLEPIKSGS
jgi:DNA-binding NarL/FixJ family response regulator